MSQNRYTEQNSDYQSWPDELKRMTDQISDNQSYAPYVINMDHPGSVDEFKRLLSEKKVCKIVDGYSEQLADYIVGENPTIYDLPYEEKKSTVQKKIDSYIGDKPTWKRGSWIYYPWNNSLLHVLSERQFLRLETFRNRNLIDEKEQEILENFNVGCLGMSTGSSTVQSLVITGVSKRLKISDKAVISGSNLNRMFVDASDIGLRKTLAVVRKMYEHNPYLEFEIFDKGLTPDLLDDFFSGKWDLNLIVDEIDDVPMKIKIRQEAKRRKIPVIMTSNIDNTVMVDIERFDIEPNRPLFHGVVDNVERFADAKNIKREEFLKMATQLAGQENLTKKMLESLKELGHTLTAAPQLGGTNLMAGAIAAYVIRQIALGKNIQSGRKLFSLDEMFSLE